MRKHRIREKVPRKDSDLQPFDVKQEIMQVNTAVNDLTTEPFELHGNEDIKIEYVSYDEF